MNKNRISLYILCIGLFFSLKTQAADFPKDTTYTTYSAYLKIRKQYPDIKIVPPIQDKNLKAFEDVVYKSKRVNGESRDLHIDIYRLNDNKVYPCLLMIHGGGWSSGDKSMERPMAQRIAKEGYVVIPVEYRKTPEAKYPAAVHDIKAAIRWVKSSSAKYGVDSSKVAIEGESAGGQLAMLVAMTNGVEEFEGEKETGNASSTVQAAIDVDGVVSFLAPNSLNTKRSANSADVKWLGATFEENPLRWKEASSGYWVNKNSVPVAFITSSMPRFHAGRDELIDMYNQFGIYSESHEIAGSPHSFWMYDPWFNPTMGYMVSFLNKLFKQK